MSNNNNKLKADINNYFNSDQNIINNFTELTEDLNNIFFDSNNIIKNLLKENNIKP